MSNRKIPRLVVAGLRGGSGKTVVSLSLITLLKNKGLQVSVFKKGPDYIDAGWLARAAEVPCYNLDLFMMSPDQVLKSFAIHSTPPLPSFIKGGSISIIEGNRGLYDGIDEKGSYSSAELAKLVMAPVVLAVDCTKTTSTIAALVLGCQKLDPDIIIGGVVLNRVATARQEDVIKKAIFSVCGIPVLGAIPRLQKDPFPERHMGLVPHQERGGIDESMAAVREIGEKYLDYDGIIKVANSAGSLKLSEESGVKSHELNQKNKLQTHNFSLRIGIIRDSAFQFYYQENFEELEKRGAELVEVSPLKDDRLPDIDALYIGGGFPETHAIALAENTKFKESLHRLIEQGLPVYAECGGLMYLGSNIRMGEKTYPMAGILPVTFRLDKKPQAHGYSIVEVSRANPFFPVRTVLKGHEFHYSRVMDVGERDVTMAFSVKRGRGIRDKKDGMCYKNTFATYTHLHAAGAPEWADGMLKAAKEYKNKKDKMKNQN